jgi:hypothetical protein
VKSIELTIEQKILNFSITVPSNFSQFIRDCKIEGEKRGKSHADCTNFPNSLKFVIPTEFLNFCENVFILSCEESKELNSCERGVESAKNEKKCGKEKNREFQV